MDRKVLYNLIYIFVELLAKCGCDSQPSNRQCFYRAIGLFLGGELVILSTPRNYEGK